MSKFKRYARKVWHFFWHEDSVASWIVNLVVAFVVIKYALYPVLGLLFGTSFPIVAVISESMEHGLSNNLICGQQFEEMKESFDNYWDLCGYWYEGKGITKEQFESFPFQNGFNKGDVIILWRASPQNLDVGDILVFQADRPQPIIHRVVKSVQDNEKVYYQTKGDHNRDSIQQPLEEHQISEERILGKGVIRIPYLGWVKILFVDALSLVGIKIVS